MRIFVRVAESGGFARAAESLGLANATVAGSVRKLERYLEVVLVEPGSRPLRLTPEGRTLLERSKEVLGALQRIEDGVRNPTREARGRLTIEATISLGQALVFPTLVAFARDYPDITLAVKLNNQPANVFASAIDVALRVGHIEDADLVARPLCESPYVMCCAPQLADALPPHPSMLDARRCLGILVENRATVMPWQLSRGDEKVKIVPAGPLHVNSGSALMGAVQSGLGVACVLDVLANRYLEQGVVRRVYPDWTTSSKTIYAVIPRSRVGSAKVRAFVDALVNATKTRRRPDGLHVVAVKKPGIR